MLAPGVAVATGASGGVPPSRLPSTVNRMKMQARAAIRDVGRAGLDDLD